MTTKAQPKNEVAALFGEPEIEAKRPSHQARRVVDVPPQILEVLKGLQENGRRAFWGVRDFNHYDTMTDVLHSAGSILNGSVLVAPIFRDEDGTNHVVKADPENWTATHIRVTVGKRRGRKVNAEQDAS